MRPLRSRISVKPLTLSRVRIEWVVPSIHSSPLEKLSFLDTASLDEFFDHTGMTQNLFRVGRHLLQAVNYRLLRARAFQVWREVACE